ncbi:glucoamylase family protein [Sphingobacterium sp. ML3W]|uniref:glucoamylase family protein n=1 Tax=Sphingobacterium sp. ML3W TaxID=1538644 RepID=UPI00068BABE0|nr:glucoamylase family protein [Sphingobacterium sp. ML3W]
MSKKLLFIIGLSFSSATCLFAQTYPEVVFENSLLSGNYAKSIVNYSGDSWVQNVKKNLPSTDSLFFTPGNSLSLRYLSSNAGNWNVTLLNDRHKVYYQVLANDVLTIKMYVQTAHTKLKSLPKIQLIQGDSQTNILELAPFIDDFDHDTWLNVEIPLSKFSDLKAGESVSEVVLHQNMADEMTHQVFIDQVEFLPKNPSRVKLSSGAILSQVSSVDKQVELQWQLPLTPSIRYIKIYRSSDNIDFKPIAIRPVFMQKCYDLVDEFDKTYYYKIAWVDYDYLESPFSVVKEIKTKPASDLELSDLIKQANVNYFIENYDINSGLFLPNKSNKRAIVSIEESGYAILSLLIGVENKQISRQAVLMRLDRMMKFLSKVQHHDGVFTAFYDGRLGVPFYRNNVQEYDVKATATLLEAMLVAREYFFKDEPQEKSLREAVTALWQRTNWTKYTSDTNPDALIDKWSSIDSNLYSKKLSGLEDGLSAYLLAMSSPTFPLSEASYKNGYARKYGSTDSSVIAPSLIMGNESSVKSDLQFIMPDAVSVEEHQIEDSLIFEDHILYGKKIEIGDLNSSMMGFYRPFLTLDPRGKYDGHVDYGQLVSNYILAYKRRDNELNLGSSYTDIWGVQNPADSLGQYLVNPAISIGAVAFEKEIGQKSLRKFYEQYAPVLFTQYGFRSWIDLKNNDVSDGFTARNQATVAILMENAKSGLIWKLYDQIPEINATLKKIYQKK